MWLIEWYNVIIDYPGSFSLSLLPSPVHAHSGCHTHGPGLLPTFQVVMSRQKVKESASFLTGEEIFLGNTFHQI